MIRYRTATGREFFGRSFVGFVHSADGFLSGITQCSSVDVAKDGLKPVGTLTRTWRGEHPDWTGEPAERFPQVLIDSGIIEGRGSGKPKAVL